VSRYTVVMVMSGKSSMVLTTWSSGSMHGELPPTPFSTFASNGCIMRAC